MKHLSDIEIAQGKELIHIKKIGAKLGIEDMVSTKLSYH